MLLFWHFYLKFSAYIVIINTLARNIHAFFLFTRLLIGFEKHPKMTTIIKNDPYSHISWRHQMETISALLALCAWNSPVTGEVSAQRPVTRSFDVIFDLRLNKRLSKQ